MFLDIYFHDFKIQDSELLALEVTFAVVALSNEGYKNTEEIRTTQYNALGPRDTCPESASWLNLIARTHLQP